MTEELFKDRPVSVDERAYCGPVGIVLDDGLRDIVDYIELGTADIGKITEKGPDLEIAPVTEDRTEVIPDGERLKVWAERRTDKLRALNKQLGNGLIDGERPDGWTSMWMEYYRIDYDKGEERFVRNNSRPEYLRDGDRKGRRR